MFCSRSRPRQPGRQTLPNKRITTYVFVAVSRRGTVPNKTAFAYHWYSAQGTTFFCPFKSIALAVDAWGRKLLIGRKINNKSVQRRSKAREPTHYSPITWLPHLPSRPHASPHALTPPLKPSRLPSRPHSSPHALAPPPPVTEDVRVTRLSLRLKMVINTFVCGTLCGEVSWTKRKK